MGTLLGLMDVERQPLQLEHGLRVITSETQIHQNLEQQVLNIGFVDGGVLLVVLQGLGCKTEV